VALGVSRNQLGCDADRAFAVFTGNEEISRTFPTREETLKSRCERSRGKAGSNGQAVPCPPGAKSDEDLDLRRSMLPSRTPPLLVEERGALDQTGARFINFESATGPKASG
jgi:hypothetical protein